MNRVSALCYLTEEKKNCNRGANTLAPNWFGSFRFLKNLLIHPEWRRYTYGLYDWPLWANGCKMVESIGAAPMTGECHSPMILFH